MNWEQKLCAMQVLRDGLLTCQEPGHWTCSLPGPVCGYGIGRGDIGRGATPEEAVNDAWQIVSNLPSDRYMLIRNGIRRVRWNGYMWVEVKL